MGHATTLGSAAELGMLMPNAAAARLGGGPPKNLRKFSIKAAVLTVFTSCGWARCRAFTVM